MLTCSKIDLQNLDPVYVIWNPRSWSCLSLLCRPQRKITAHLLGPHRGLNDREKLRYTFYGRYIGTPKQISFMAYLCFQCVLLLTVLRARVRQPCSSGGGCENGHLVVCGAVATFWLVSPQPGRLSFDNSLCCLPDVSCLLSHVLNIKYVPFLYKNTFLGNEETDEKMSLVFSQGRHRLAFVQ